MATEIYYKGRQVQLHDTDLIGSGGEGSVFRLAGGQYAVKVYTDNLPHRTSKLRVMTNGHFNLNTTKIAFPYEVVTDRVGNVIGYVMRLLPPSMEELGAFANKRMRASLGVTTKVVADTFLDIARELGNIHREGFVVGDFNDRNILVNVPQQDAYWIDVDSWQKDNHPCVVATELYVDPQLYGVNFASRPVFKTENDWYSFAVLLFKSLLLAHPYGGVHQQYGTVPTRAQQRITVFDPSVKYPAVAISLNLLDKRLEEIFRQIFEKNWRGQFPITDLEQYSNSLAECPKCGMWYPFSTVSCPQCNARMLATKFQAARSAQGQFVVDTFFTFTGEIVYQKVENRRIILVIRNKNDYKLHILHENGRKEEVDITNLKGVLKGSKFAFFADYLVIAKPQSTELYSYRFSSGSIAFSDEIYSQVSAITRQSVFKGGAHKLFWSMNNRLCSGYYDVRYTQSINPQVERDILGDQFWLSVSTETFGDVDEIWFGLFRSLVGKRPFYKYLLGYGQYRYEVDGLAPLADDETLTNITVKYAMKGILVIRHLDKAGQNGQPAEAYVRLDVVTYRNQVTTKLLIKESDLPVADIDEVIFRIDLHGNSSITTFDNAKIVIVQLDSARSVTEYALQNGSVKAGDSIQRFSNGLILAIGDSYIRKISS